MVLTANEIDTYIKSNKLDVEGDILKLILNKETFQEGLGALKEFLKSRQFNASKTGENLELEKNQYAAYLTLLRLL